MKVKLPVAILACLAWPASTRATDVWIVQLQKTPILDLFVRQTDWSRIHALKLSTQFVMRGDPNELRAVVNELNSRGIYLAIEALIQSGDGTCGRGVEGFESPRAMQMVASKIAAAGGKLSYVAMDEPLWFGTHKCSYAVKAVAADIARKVRDLKAVFPEVQIGDIEPAGTPLQEWPAMVDEWAKEFREATVVPLAFLHLDVQWHRSNWREQVDAMRGLGLPIGIIINGRPQDASSAEWSRNANKHFFWLGFKPDYLIVQSWHRFPIHYGPDSDQDSLLGVAKGLRP